MPQKEACTFVATGEPTEIVWWKVTGGVCGVERVGAMTRKTVTCENDERPPGNAGVMVFRKRRVSRRIPEGVCG